MDDLYRQALAALGGPALSDGRGPIYRRPRPAEPSARNGGALAPCARADRRHRRRSRAPRPWRPGGLHQRRSSCRRHRSASFVGPERRPSRCSMPMAPRCLWLSSIPWRSSACATSASRSPWSSPRTLWRRAMPPSWSRWTGGRMPAVTEVDGALAEGAPLLWPELSSNRSFQWEAGEQGRRRGTSERGGACHRAGGRLSARDRCVHGAACRDRQLRPGHSPLHAARRLPVGAPAAHRAGAGAGRVRGCVAGDRAGRRRRFRRAQHRLSGVRPGLVRGQGARASGEMGRRAQRELRRRRPGAQPASARNARLWMATAASSRCRSLRPGVTAATSPRARCSFWCTGWRRWCAGRIAFRSTISRSRGCSPTPRRSRRTAASRAPSSPIFSSASSMPPPGKSGSTASSSGAAT